MHELSIALSIIEIAGEAVGKEGFGRIGKIRVQVGRASGVMTEALKFSFEAAREGTAAEGALLEIEEVPLGGSCRSCGGEFTADGPYLLACPLCEGGDFVIDRGQELNVIDLEVED